MATEFNPEMLIVARESRGMTQAELSREVGLQQGTVSRIEAGLHPITDVLLNRFSVVLRYPVEFFFNSDRVFGFNSTVFFHRRRIALPEKVLRAIHAQINIRRFNLKKLLRSVELKSPYSFFPLDLAEFGGRVDRVAQMVRSTWHLPSGPVRNMTRCIEDAGGVVVRLDFGTRQVDAISEWVPNGRPLFFMNSGNEITGDRIRMTLAHEAGHLFLHHIPGPDMEEQANKFAAEFLMPARDIKSSLNRLSLPKLADLKMEWRVSMAALIERANDLKTITPSQREYLHIQLGRAGYKTREPIETDIPIEKPVLLKQLVDTHLGQLGYTKSEMSRLVGLFDDEFQEIYLGSGRLRLVS